MPSAFARPPARARATDLPRGPLPRAEPIVGATFAEAVVTGETETRVHLGAIAIARMSHGAYPFAVFSVASSAGKHAARMHACWVVLVVESSACAAAPFDMAQSAAKAAAAVSALQTCRLPSTEPRMTREFRGLPRRDDAEHVEHQRFHGRHDVSGRSS